MGSAQREASSLGWATGSRAVAFVDASPDDTSIVIPARSRGLLRRNAWQPWVVWLSLVLPCGAAEETKKPRREDQAAVAALVQGGADVRRCPYGLVLSVAIPDDRRDLIAHLAGVPYVRDVGLPRSAGDADLVHLRGLSRMENLSANFSQITNEGLKVIGGFKSLKRLSLMSTKIDDDGLEHLAGLPELESIVLRGISINGSGFGAFRNTKSLTDLDLLQTEVDDRGVARLARFKQLKTLDLVQTRVTDECVTDLEKLKNLESLRLPRQISRGAAMSLHLALPQAGILP